MLHRLVIVLLLTGAFAAPAAALRALPASQARTAVIRELLVPANCAPPCLLGIAIGRDPLTEDVERLRAHRWIAQVFHHGRPGAATFWDWSEAFPLHDEIISASAVPVTSIHDGLPIDDRWDTIDLITTLPMGTVIAALGPPDVVRVNALFNQPGQASGPAAGPALFTPISGMRLIATYSAYGIWVTSSFFPCPTDAAALWLTPAAITISAKPPTTFGVVYTQPDGGLPRWFFHVRPNERCG